jgi:hypothetical protein
VTKITHRWPDDDDPIFTGDFVISTPRRGTRPTDTREPTQSEQPEKPKSSKPKRRKKRRSGG